MGKKLFVALCKTAIPVILQVISRSSITKNFFMRLAPVLLAMVFVLASCSSTKKTTATNVVSTSNTTPATTSATDGSSFENAIIIKEKTETSGVRAEYDWLKKNYPGYSLISQALSSKGNKKYDVLKISTKDGEEKSIYFDITGFFGKF
ncbi:MAG TPA: hypothetical protein VK483_04925 [Chitinophagaceae bacterium]|nr:hypothetical protein [Chitinophagaceae bacterium]